MPDIARNAYLRRLSAATRGRLDENLKRVELKLGDVIQRQGLPTDWVYFPEGALLSLISLAANGQSVETTTVGLEGAGGLLEACGSGVSVVECVVQVDGAAWRSPAALCRRLAMSDPEFSAAAWRNVELQTAESRQSGLCQALHSVEERFARWLLESLERSGRRNPLPLTQEFLAALLGVQRTTVSAFASQLQKEGLISYSRGRITLEDEAALEARACECRRAIQLQRQRLDLTPIRLGAD